MRLAERVKEFSLCGFFQVEKWALTLLQIDL